jgi:hypothetical protein
MKYLRIWRDVLNAPVNISASPPDDSDTSVRLRLAVHRTLNWGILEGGDCSEIEGTYKNEYLRISTLNQSCGAKNATKRKGSYKCIPNIFLTELLMCFSAQNVVVIMKYYLRRTGRTQVSSSCLKTLGKSGLWGKKRTLNSRLRRIRELETATFGLVSFVLSPPLRMPLLQRHVSIDGMCPSHRFMPCT